MCIKLSIEMLSSKDLVFWLVFKIKEWQNVRHDLYTIVVDILQVLEFKKFVFKISCYRLWKAFKLTHRETMFTFGAFFVIYCILFVWL